MINNSTLQQFYRVSGAACLCIALSGCPSASNPTQPEAPPQTPPPSSLPPPASSASSSAGNASNNDSSQHSQRSSAPASEAGSQPNGDQTSTAGGGSDTMGPPEDDTQASGASGEQAAQSSSEASKNDGNSAEPGFGDQSARDDSLPELGDTPNVDDRPTGIANAPGESGVTAPVVSGSGSPGQPDSQAANTGEPDTDGGSSSYGWPAGMSSSGGPYGMPAGNGEPLTPDEQVAILDAQLEKGAGEFEDTLFEAQAEQRAAGRAQAARRPPTSIASASDDNTGQGNRSSVDGIAETGKYGGIDRASEAGSVSQSSSNFTWPEDIGDGYDDDTFAAQLRELAENESDPAIRKKRWDRYREYTGNDPTDKEE